MIIPTRITGRQRVRKQFAELGLAKEFAKSQFKGKEEFGSQFFELDGKKMREAQLAMAELPPGHSLLDAVREYTKQLKKDKRNPIAVDEAVSTYVKTLKKLNSFQ